MNSFELFITCTIFFLQLSPISIVDDSHSIHFTSKFTHVHRHRAADRTENRLNSSHWLKSVFFLFCSSATSFILFIKKKKKKDLAMNRPPSLKMIEPRLPSRRSGAVCLAVRLASEDRHDPNYICTILKLGLK